MKCPDCGKDMILSTDATKKGFRIWICYNDNCATDSHIEYIPV